MSESYSNYAEEELEKSEQAFKDAERMRKVDVSDEAVVSRLYYALYHSVKAALYSKGLNPKTHGGVVSDFGEYLMGDYGVTREDARFVSLSQTRREEADYDYKPGIDEDISTIFERTEEVMEKMENIVEEES